MADPPTALASTPNGARAARAERRFNARNPGPAGLEKRAPAPAFSTADAPDLSTLSRA